MMVDVDFLGQRIYSDDLRVTSALLTYKRLLRIDRGPVKLRKK